MELREESGLCEGSGWTAQSEIKGGNSERSPACVKDRAGQPRVRSKGGTQRGVRPV